MTVSERLLALVQEIEVRPGQSAEALAKRFEASARTIERDIYERLPTLGVVVVNERGFRFEYKPHLQPLALTHEEVVSLTLAHRVAEPHLDERTSKALQAAIDKIRRGIGTTDRLTAEKLDGRTAVSPGPETSADTSQPFFAELAEAISRQQQIYFEYRGRDSDDTERRWVQPLGLFFQEKRWYLQAYDLNRQGTRTFRLGRLSNLEITHTRFEPKDQFSAEAASFHQWDIAQGEPVEFEFSVTEALGRWFEENKPHPSVRVQGTRAFLSVTDPEAFLRWFSSLDDAELIKPETYRTVFTERLTRLQAAYQT